MNAQALDSLKEKLIFQIKEMKDEESVRQIKEFVNQIQSGVSRNQSEKLKKLAKPMRKKTTVDNLIREQNWKPVDRSEFDRLVKELDIEEPLEQLIADIGK